jgi:hypothetical protein
MIANPRLPTTHHETPAASPELPAAGPEPPNINQRGAALLISLMAMLVMLALGTAVMLVAITETRIASSYGAGIETLYAAEAGVERAISDLRAIPDWRGLASSATMSGFVDGPPGGTRTLPDGRTLDLTEATSAPWRVFACGPLAGLLPPGSIESRAYVVVWVADPSTHDPASLALLAHAYGPQGARRVLEVVVARVDLDGSPEIRTVSWREGPEVEALSGRE